jgi:outer membrane lipoprotein LolB
LTFRALNILACITLLTAVLPACRTVQPTDSEQAERIQLYESRSSELRQFENWSLEGRLAVSNGEDGGSGHLNWQEQAGGSRMDFHGAMGRGAWRLLSDGQGAVLEMADGARFQAESVDELIRAQLGWEIPVDTLAWWVRGMAAPGEIQFQVLDDEGHLNTLHQRDWAIEFGNYRQFGELQLPVKMTARQEKKSVKLAIRRWELGTDRETQ